LERIARGGAEAFYTGDVAAQIDADMQRHDGFLRADDLAFVPWPIERRPVQRRYRDVLVATTPPPGAGRTLLLALMTLGQLRSRFVREHGPRRNHFFAEALRKVFLTRRNRPFDPATWPQVRDKLMLSRAYARQVAQSIADEMDVQLPFEDPPDEEMDTTHFSVMDREGGVVSMTQSVELVYGAKVAAEGLGFLYNNYMQALETKNPAHPYYLRPGAVPWSSATPAIVFREGRPWLAVGSPGSERIFSTVCQFLIRVVDGSDSMDRAIHEPRLHCSIGGTVSLEPERFDPEVVERLEALGYKLKRLEPYAFYLGCIQAVLRRQTGPGFQGVADPRRDGTAGGPG
jgi:gamma-glutamyltranspeptidase/glutathione hydrolase